MFTETKQFWLDELNGKYYWLVSRLRQFQIDMVADIGKG